MITRVFVVSETKGTWGNAIEVPGLGTLNEVPGLGALNKHGALGASPWFRRRLVEH